MKKVLLFLVIVTFIACKKEATVDYAIISGKIINKPVGEVSINSLDRSFAEALKFTTDGTFNDTLNTDIKNYVLYDGTNPVFIYVEPGNELNITYDAYNFENSIVISGKGSEPSHYLMTKRKNEQDLFGSSAETFSLNEVNFKAKLNEIKKSNENLLENTSGLSKDFKTKEKRNIYYFYLNRLNDYEGAHRYFTKNETFQVSDDFLNEYDSFDFTNEEDFNFSSDYKRILTNHYGNQAKDLAEKESMASDLAYVKTTSAIESQTIKNGLLFDFASYNLSYSKDINAFYEAFLANSTNTENNAVITEKFNKLNALAKGRPSPKFIDYINFEGGKTSLDDFKGKYVYIDVWATWCGPCIREIPSLKEIEKQFHDSNIEFVSISIDKASDYDKWKSMVSTEALGGIQLFADNNLNSSFLKDYQISGIPRFILIDTEGNIVNANAPRPSSPKLKALLSGLNI